jgi:pyrroloquinoline quinone biosynthesis protein B
MSIVPMARAVMPLALAPALVLAACGVEAGRGTGPVRDAASVPSPAAGAAAEPASERPPGPYVRVIGTVQDGGLPHAGCTCERCEAARRDPARRRLVASLAVVLPASGRVVLIDATPDLHEQLDLLADVRDAPAGVTDRAPVDGVLLTHAHVGHYLGLAFFGYESMHTRDLPVWCTPRMASFLRENGPWSLLVGRRNVELRETAPGEAVALGEGVTARAVPAPHRDEYTDTVGWRLEGPNRTVFYVPDTDGWDAWDRPLPAVLAGVDVALLDATFYSLDELPGRRVEEIGHPLITDTMDRLQAEVDAGRLDVRFIHLNHTNPALDPESPAAREIARRGYAVAAEGEEIGL